MAGLVVGDVLPMKSQWSRVVMGPPVGLRWGEEFRNVSAQNGHGWTQMHTEARGMIADLFCWGELSCGGDAGAGGMLVGAS